MEVQLEGCESCSCDSLTLYDASTSSVLLGPLCGSAAGASAPDPVCASPGADMEASFVTDATAERKGFQVVVYEVKATDERCA